MTIRHIAYLVCALVFILNIFSFFFADYSAMADMSAKAEHATKSLTAAAVAVVTMFVCIIE